MHPDTPWLLVFIFSLETSRIRPFRLGKAFHESPHQHQAKRRPVRPPVPIPSPGGALHPSKHILRTYATLVPEEGQSPPPPLRPPPAVPLLIQRLSSARSVWDSFFSIHFVIILTSPRCVLCFSFLFFFPSIRQSHPNTSLSPSPHLIFQPPPPSRLCPHTPSTKP